MDVPSVRSGQVLRLEHFCYCCSLTNGIRVITVVALVFGAVFMFLSTELIDTDYYTDIMFASCKVTGILFLSWFLILLLLQSLAINIISKKLAVWIGITLAVWLLILTGLFIILLFIQGFTGDDESYYIIVVILAGFLGDVSTFYSICVLISYLYILQEQRRSRSLESPAGSNFHPDLFEPSTHQPFFPSVSQKESFVSMSSSQRNQPAGGRSLFNTPIIQERKEQVDNYSKKKKRVSEELSKQIKEITQSPVFTVQSNFVKERQAFRIHEDDESFQECKTARNSLTKSQQTTPSLSYEELQSVQMVPSPAIGINQHTHVNEDYFNLQSSQDIESKLYQPSPNYRGKYP